MKIDLRWSLVAFAITVAGCGKKDAATGDAGATATSTAAPAAATGMPARAWTEQVAATPEGGFVMGNPNAPVKLIEYGSLTCPHCADFATAHEPILKQKYVSTGKVSYEFRNYVRDGIDLSAALLAQCGGVAPFFKLTEQLYAEQQTWMGKLMAIPPAEAQRLQALPAEQQAVAMVQASGLDEFMKQRGIGSEKVKACLTDQARQNKLLDMRKVAETQFNLSGTPTFAVNGKVLGTPAWDELEAALKAAGA